MAHAPDEVYLLFGEFAKFFGDLPPEDFRVRFPHPFLEVQIKKGVYEARDAQAALQTHVDGDTVYEKPDERDWKKAVIVQVRKTKRNVVPGVVTAGRSLKNDVILPHEAVSKLHVYFKKDPTTGLFSITEVGSTYGTTVNGHPLVEGKTAPLESGMELVFGRTVHALFFSPLDFHSYMRLKLRTGKTRKMKRDG